MKAKLCILGAVLSLMTAQQVWALQDFPKLSVIERSPFTPEFVLTNQSEIGLTPEQKQGINAVTLDIQKRLAELKRIARDETRDLDKIINQENADELQALNSLDKLLLRDREYRRLQVTQLFKIKNILRPDQQKRLWEIKNIQMGR